MISDLIGLDPIHGCIRSNLIRSNMDNVGSVITADATALNAGAKRCGGRQRTIALALPASGDAGGRQRALPSAPQSPDRAGVASHFCPRRRRGETRGPPANAPANAGVRQRKGRQRALRGLASEDVSAAKVHSREFPGWRKRENKGRLVERGRAD